MKKEAPKTQKILNIWAIVLIIWALYRAKLSLPPWFDEFIAKPIVFLLPVYIYIKKYEKTTFQDAVSLLPKNIWKELLLAIGICALLFITAFSTSYIKHQTVDLTFLKNINTFIPILLLSLATGVTEEILSRGFILKRLYDESHNVFTSSFVASILFFILHIPILFTMPNLSGNLLIFFMITDLLLSFANSFIFLTRKNLILVILIHAFYNIVISFYL